MIKILITGIPESGKSTLTKSVIDRAPRSCGFITREMRDGNGERSGFEILRSDGATALLARKGLHSPYMVEDYGVDLPAFESMLPGLSDFTVTDMLYIDEIGQMELFSTAFPKLVATYLDAPNIFIGSISKIYNNDYLQSLRDDPRIHIIDIDRLGRESARNEVHKLLATTAFKGSL